MILELLFTVNLAKAMTWTLHPKIEHNGNSITIKSDTFEFEQNGAKCLVSKILTFGKGTQAWSMRTLSCTKGDYEVAGDVSCGARMGKNNSTSFEMKIKGTTIAKPLLICESK